MGRAGRKRGRGVAQAGNLGGGGGGRGEGKGVREGIPQGGCLEQLSIGLESGLKGVQ